MKRHFLVALIAMSTLAACKKDKGTDEPGGPSNPGTPSKTLKKIVETKAGQTTTYNLTYDASKRLSSVSSTDNSEVTSFTYANDGNVTKIENKEGNERNVFEITYNNGIPVSGTYKTFEKNGANETITDQYSLQYTLENALVTKIKMIVPADPENDEEGYELEYTLSYTDGNLTKVETGGLFGFTASFTYGNKKPLFPKLFKYVLDPAGFSLEFFAKNDLLTMHYDYPGTELDNTITNVYTYDANGYVLTANDGETQTTFEYQ
jgi:YD repeat-containing protein